MGATFGRKLWGAGLSAGIMLLGAVGWVSAAAPTYAISVSKTARPSTVPAEGADVAFTVWVTSTGSGFFQLVNVSDSLAGCTVSGPSGDVGSDGKLSSGETWTYTCTVNGVMPDTTNIATVNACHNTSGSCNQSSHDATNQGEVTVTVDLDDPRRRPSLPARRPRRRCRPACRKPDTERRRCRR